MDILITIFERYITKEDWLKYRQDNPGSRPIWMTVCLDAEMTVLQDGLFDDAPASFSPGILGVANTVKVQGDIRSILPWIILDIDDFRWRAQFWLFQIEHFALGVYGRLTQWETSLGGHEITKLSFSLKGENCWEVT